MKSHFSSRRPRDAGAARASIAAMSRLAYYRPDLVEARPGTQAAEVCVYGATAGGVIAAVQAAAMGRRVLLLDPGDHLGGLSAGGLGWTSPGWVGSALALGGLLLWFVSTALDRRDDGLAAGEPCCQARAD